MSSGSIVFSHFTIGVVDAKETGVPLIPKSPFSTASGLLFLLASFSAVMIFCSSCAICVVTNSAVI